MLLKNYILVRDKINWLVNKVVDLKINPYNTF